MAMALAKAMLLRRDWTRLPIQSYRVIFVWALLLSMSGTRVAETDF